MGSVCRSEVERSQAEYIQWLLELVVLVEKEIEKVMANALTEELSSDEEEDENEEEEELVQW